ncbi:peptidase M48-like protein [Acinetobacter calcoaceticus]|uniref:Peptidase M48-like protein n=1 Tax=Acinetobacter calcoaceticus TaxID=471 RepID=A0A4R1XK12_ACICA|nr:peptidase M48-like protein [Acinetobacter calcoaceticus]
MIRKFSLIASLIATSLAFTGCQISTMAGIGHDRKQLMLYSKDEFYKQSDESYKQIMSYAYSQKAVVKSPQVDRVAKRLIAQVGYYRADSVDWEWEVNTLHDNDINAFCLSGGKIGVLTGMMSRLKVTDDELAAIIGHEIAHALRDHGREKMSKKLISSLGILAASSAGLGDIAISGTSILGEYGYNLPGSRSLESEADLLGLELMVRAGYKPEAAISFWQKVIATEQSGVKLDFLSTHPANQKRIDNIQAHIIKMKSKQA